MTGIDHLMSVLPSLESAAMAARRLGFRVTDRGVHTGRGTANHLILLPGCYWELLAIEEPTSHNALLRATLARPGLLGCALRAAGLDVGPTPAALRGIQVEAPVELSRPLGSNGDAPLARFRTARMRTDGQFDAFFFYCEHLTPELVWRDEAMDHPNGATRLVGVDVIAPDVGAAAAFLTQTIGAPVAEEARDSVTLAGDNLEIWIATPRAYAERYVGAPTAVSPDRLGALVGLRFRVSDLARTEAQIADADGVTTRRSEEGLYAYDDALGQTLFHFLAA